MDKMPKLEGQIWDIVCKNCPARKTCGAEGDVQCMAVDDDVPDQILALVKEAGWRPIPSEVEFIKQIEGMHSHYCPDEIANLLRQWLMERR